MKTETKSQIIEFIKKNKSSRPHDIVNFLQITPSAVHRHLKKLVLDGIIKKNGTPPHVYYALAEPIFSQTNTQQLNNIGFENYLYVSPTGEMQNGVDGFQAWVRSVKEEPRLHQLIEEYKKIRGDSNHFFKFGVINATERLQNVFGAIELDKVFYLDFYSLPKFGKTKLGQLVLHGKQAQNKKIIRNVAEIINEQISRLCKREKIEAIAWVPHSLPRKVQFLKELEQILNLPYPQIHIVKTFSGQVIVAQKTLSKLEDRIKNASETMMVKEMSLKYKNVILIDDAVGSGATLNEAAKKLKEKGIRKVIGLAIVGSYKGFEVIKEV